MTEEQRAAIIEKLEHIAQGLGDLRDYLFTNDVLEGDPHVEPGDPFVLPPKSKGIDVSHYQGVIDWAKVKAAGIAFAFIKATEGITFIDSKFADNWRASKLAGVPRGAYHFYRFAYDPIAQANFFASIVGTDTGELPLVVDVEDSVTTVKIEKTIKVFCERVFALTGRRCIIYTGNWWWTAQRVGGPQAWAKDYPLWIAAYVEQPKLVIPRDWTAWAFWQHANNGRVSGISGNVDLDVSA